MSLSLAQIIGLLVGVVLPLLVGLVTKRVTSSGTKAVLLAALAAITGFLTEVLSVDFDLGQAIITWLGAFLVAVGMHFGLWKPTGTSDSLQKVGSGSSTPRDPNRI